MCRFLVFPNQNWFENVSPHVMLQDTQVMDLLKGTAPMLTKGSAYKEDIDYEAMWRRELARRPQENDEQGDCQSTTAVDKVLLVMRNLNSRNKKFQLGPRREQWRHSEKKEKFPEHYCHINNRESYAL